VIAGGVFQVWQLFQAMKPKLEDIIPDDLFVGTSLILRQAGRFLYGMRPIKSENGRPVIELTGIGGGMEQVDDTYTAGAIREAHEEIGCDVQLIPLPETLIIRSRDHIERIELAGPEQPAALVFRNYRTPPHQPWHPHNSGKGCLIVYLARLMGVPRPVMELPWLMWLGAEQVLQTAREDVALHKLLSSDAELLLGEKEPPPLSSWVRLTDSQEALGLALGDSLPAFYRSLP
jgi:hypothetical protein